MMGAISTKFHREVLSQAKEIVGALGGTCRLIHGHGGHGKLIISLNGKERESPIASTPRCADNSVYMKLADVRRILREMVS